MSGMTPYQNTRRTIGTIVFLLAGPILWSLHLTLIYGPQSALCAMGQGTGTDGDNPAVVASVGVVTLVAVLLGLASAVMPEASYRMLAGEKAPAGQWSFFRSVMQTLMGLSLLAIVYAGSAALFMPACAQLR